MPAGSFGNWTAPRNCVTWWRRLEIAWKACTETERGQYSIRINDQWRVCFIWREGNAYDVEIVDYH
ncbi:MAG: type II toxin-antitoxin system RelE/ParE family toxin [Terriglobales bacterium]